MSHKYLTMTLLMAMVDDEFMVNLVSYICVYGVLNVVSGEYYYIERFILNRN